MKTQMEIKVFDNGKYHKLYSKEEIKRCRIQHYINGEKNFQERLNNNTLKWVAGNRENKQLKLF